MKSGFLKGRTFLHLNPPASCNFHIDVRGTKLIPGPKDDFLTSDSYSALNSIMSL